MKEKRHILNTWLPLKLFAKIKIKAAQLTKKLQHKDGINRRVSYNEIIVMILAEYFDKKSSHK